MDDSICISLLVKKTLGRLSITVSSLEKALAMVSCKVELNLD